MSTDPQSPDRPVPNTLIRETILAQTEAAGLEKSVSPSDVARALATQWQRLLSRVRKEAEVLQGEGAIDILRKGKPVPPEEVRGVIRLRRRAPGAAAAKAEISED